MHTTNQRKSTTPPNKRDTWATDEKVVAAVEAMLNIRFELDVCAVAATSKCFRYFGQDIGIDGLNQQWARFNWCNPPFSTKIDWLKKARREALLNQSCTAIVLPEDGSTEVNRLLRAYSDFIMMPQRRICYYDDDGVMQRQNNFYSTIGWVTPWADLDSTQLRELKC